jgi:Tfp pilus assembly protein PilF
MSWQAAAHGSAKADVFAVLAYRRLGQNDRAQQMLQQCIESATRPDATADDAYAAGLAQHAQGDKDRAQQDFHHALALDPLFWPARVAMAEMDRSDIVQPSL